MSSQLESADNPWPTYYKKMRGRPPRETLQRALAGLEAEGVTAGHALDLGAGNGRDALELLRRGWRVTAVDRQSEGLAEIEQAGKDLPGALTTLRQPMEALTSLPPADLINASFCLFLVARDDLAALMERIKEALPPGGRFAGHFIGPKDSWADREGMTPLSEEKLRALLAPLEIEWWWEEEDDSRTPRGEEKHWHLFHVVAKKARS